ncbi:ABC transporter ATP-binding protein [Propioniciclava soli]|uniref:ABC transporter ATP-binding protein n=1 Tax=Propioniciclava soli TaxID=2775081 RepID=UPI001E29722D|nr:ABC transporter ATP-binding protein [Propioniciclava soli]
MVTGLTVRDAVVRYTTTEGDTRRPPNRRPILSWVPPPRPKPGATRTITAVDGVSLDVGPGEIVALLGASGSGKSSLLRAIAGLEPLASGSVAWDGADLARVAVHKRNFGLMFQEPALFPNLDVGANVAYGLHALPRARRSSVAAEFLELVGLPGFARRRVTELSGGQAQRVALARSLAPRPRLMLLDEPLSALDRALRERLVEVLGEVLRATGTPAVHVTHDQDEAFALADRVAVLADGALLQVGTPAELWRQPASAAVARFLGYGTFLTDADAATLGVGRLAASGLVGLGPASLVLDAGGVRLPVRAENVRRGYVSIKVELPSGQVAEVRAPEATGLDAVGVRLDPDAVAVVRDADPTAR